jgi:hypothetical protein
MWCLDINGYGCEYAGQQLIANAGVIRELLHDLPRTMCKVS